MARRQAGDPESGRSGMATYAHRNRRPECLRRRPRRARVWRERDLQPSARRPRGVGVHRRRNVATARSGERRRRGDGGATMKAHEIPKLDPQPRDEQGHGYIDFLASEKLSVGLAIWPAGTVDRQRPHLEDEVYYVISGKATIEVAGERRPVKAGSLVFVEAGVDHRFHDIEEDIRVLVFWA